MDIAHVLELVHDLCKIFGLRVLRKHELYAIANVLLQKSRNPRVWAARSWN
jgi:hypothetical protein